MSSLDNIQFPEDLKNLKSNDLPQVCDDLRQFIVDVVSTKGGHFGASLGVVELTVALHYVFNTPYDQLVWDVGHQAYGHKILTGRKDRFHTNRIYNGISGFPKRSESEYDTFGVGHSSTSISGALGMAVASNYKNEKDKQHIAVIGDGSMTAGLAFEGLNHAGIENSNLLVILNDNCMSIDPNVGALKEYLTDIATSHTYNKVKDDVWNLLGKVSKFGPNAQAIAAKLENAMKSALLKQSNYFESLNFRYFGPVDGHDVVHLSKILNDLKDIPGPKLLHCVTRKGAKYEPAELGSSTKWHAPGLFNKETGEFIGADKNNTTPKPPKFQDVFGQTIIDLAKLDKRIVGVTPAMPSGCSLKMMMEQMPDRAFDVGIAEQHAVTFSAGMAAQGNIVFCNIYSTFLQRAYDQIIHDVCLQNLPVIFCLDRAGLVGEDGATHHGIFDINYLRCIPNLIVFAPRNEVELRNIMYTAQLGLKNPIAIRYPRGRGKLLDWRKPFSKIEIGKAVSIKKGENIAILTIGTVVNNVINAIENCSIAFEISCYDMRFVKPIDEKLLHRIFKKYNTIITVEDGIVMGGFGSAILEFAAKNNYNIPIKNLGISDKFPGQGTIDELHEIAGISSNKISQTLNSYLEKKLP